MLAAASGNVDAVDALLDARRRGRTPRSGARPDRGDVRRGARTAPRCSTLLAARGADLKATSKVDRPGGAQQGSGGAARAHAGQPGAARRAAGRRRQRPAPQAAGRAARRPRRRRRPASIATSSYNELVAAQGGLTPLLFAARQGYIDVGARRCSTPAPTSTRSSAGDKTSPLLIATINGHFDLARLLLEKGADPNAGAENDAHAALRRAERRVGAEGALPAAARAHASRRRPISS